MAMRIGFNGAATARSRNSIDATSVPPLGVVLQWGRDRAVAEFQRAAGE